MPGPSQSPSSPPTTSLPPARIFSAAAPARTAGAAAPARAAHTPTAPAAAHTATPRTAAAHTQERRHQLRGLLLLALAVLLFSLLRAGGLSLFHPGWWRLW